MAQQHNSPSAPVQPMQTVALRQTEGPLLRKYEKVADKGTLFVGYSDKSCYLCSPNGVVYTYTSYYSK